MFFRRKKDDDSDLQQEFEAVKASVEGTLPDAVEEEPVTGLTPIASAPLVSSEATIRLFPGFEHEDFEVGFAAESAEPSLVMRWKDGGSWFTMPAMFNRAVLSSMDERESANDLPRLLRSYGYDVEPRA
ncbi:hypothetical protein HK107_05500 [Parvularcula sp. ZS-1/3]|uniref:Uncharacterized protein n=1 Tax=Parvularcula mediterranea TaxID=2732508 RepID=A0A7Y3W4Q2_9PROT|nr:hypothetical protein [Parvularcula mediterranea]NNU15774.1 hypothetical protein [Parvularcula mediterranea]